MKVIEEKDGKTWRTRGMSAASLNVFPQIATMAEALGARYTAFKAAVKAGTPEFVRLDASGTVVTKQASTSVPTFLCTDAALECFAAKAAVFKAIAQLPAVKESVPASRRGSPTATANPLATIPILTQHEAYCYLDRVVQYVASVDFARGQFH